MKLLRHDRDNFKILNKLLNVGYTSRRQSCHFKKKS